MTWVAESASVKAATNKKETVAQMSEQQHDEVVLNDLYGHQQRRGKQLQTVSTVT